MERKRHWWRNCATHRRHSEL